MHLLARNLASQLTSSLAPDAAIKFGETFRFRNVYYGKTKERECVTIEEFIDGKFMKYLNNTGLLCGDKADPLCQKAECLAHFSHEKSKGKILLVDIQGGGFELYDPEIASLSCLMTMKCYFVLETCLKWQFPISKQPISAINTAKSLA